MEIKSNIEYGDLKKLIKEMSKTYSVKVGLLAGKGGEESVTENLDMAALGLVHEFGADINHPGGTPYFINEYGMATFVKKDSFYGQLLIKRGQVTKPHNINIPARPWLSMPLTRNGGKDLKNKIDKNIKKISGTNKGEFTDYLIKSGDFGSLAVILGVSAVEQIQEAFDTEGFGEWQPNAPATIAQKHSEMPLIDKGNLRKRVTYEVTNG